MTRPTVDIEPTPRLWALERGAAARYAQVLYIFVWRDLKIRYKQTIVGVAWAVFQPLATTLILTVVFGMFAKIPSNGVPYVLFAAVGLLPWTYFAQAINESTVSLVSDRRLLTKAYFPRLLLPLASVLRPLGDLAVSFIAVLALMTWFGRTPTWSALALPIVVLVAVVTALGVGLWLSALYVRYRDVGHTFPFLVQLWMFASPVVYPVSLVPEPWRAVYGLNPMTGVIEAFRWALLETEPPDPWLMAASAATVLAFVLAGALFFRRMERTFADFV